MITKTEYAFQETCEKLFRESKQVYFWTFTMREVLADWCYSRVWRRFMLDIGDLYGGLLRGVRVVELHKSHGIHWHCLLNKRVWVGEVRRIGKRYGVGRVSVKLADRGAIGYLVKYISKDFGGPKIHAGLSRWGTVGGFVGIRKNDVIVDSPFHRRLDFYREQTGEKKVPFLVARAIMKMDGGSERDVKQLAAVVSETGCISVYDPGKPMLRDVVVSYPTAPGSVKWGAAVSRNAYDGVRAGRTTVEALESMHNEGVWAIRRQLLDLRYDDAAAAAGGRWSGP